MRHFSIFSIIAICFAITMMISTAVAGVPQLMNYQGQLTDTNGVALDTTVSMTFAIYDDSTGGTTVWQETQGSVVVEDGICNVMLGTVDPIDYSIFDDPELYLSIAVGGDPEISPRTRLTTVPYAGQAAQADTAVFALTSGAPGESAWTRIGNIVRLVNESDTVVIGGSTKSGEAEGNLKVDGNIVVDDPEDTKSTYVNAGEVGVRDSEQPFINTYMGPGNVTTEDIGGGTSAKMEPGSFEASNAQNTASMTSEGFELVCDGETK
jgi:hypothetical protein